MVEFATGAGIDGGDRYAEIREIASPSPGVTACSALDRTTSRAVRLFAGPADLLAPLCLAAELGHPLLVPVYDVGRNADGPGFATTMDPEPGGEAVPLEPRLLAVADLADLLASAAVRGVTRARTAASDLVALSGGRIVLDGVFDWQEASPESASIRALRQSQDVLRQILRQDGADRGVLAAIAEYPYPSAPLLAADLRALVRGTRLAGVPDPLGRRIRLAARSRPGFVAALAGVAVVGSALGAFALREREVARSRDAQDRLIAGEERLARARTALEQAAELARRVDEIDRERSAAIDELEARYHQVETIAPDETEQRLQARIERLSARIGGAVPLVLEQLAAAGDAQAAPAIEARLRDSDLRWLLRLALFEEGKTLSTRTFSRARATSPAAEALARRDLAGAHRAAQALPSGHPFRQASLAAVAQAERSGASEGVRSAIAYLRATGWLAVEGLPPDAAARLSEVASDEEERWTLSPLREFAGDLRLELPMGEYLVEVERGGTTFRFDCLVARAATWTVDAATLPPEVPEGYLWIPPSAFYVGGEARLNPGRYRRCRTAAPFLIARTELSFQDYAAWLGDASIEHAAEDFPAFDAGPFLMTVFDENFEVVPSLRHIVRMHFPAHSFGQGAALRLCSSLSLPAGWRGCLPSPEEWELSARGVAGRRFPWGDAPLELPSSGGLSGVVAAAGVDDPTPDVSIFGVSAMGTGISEWTGASPDDLVSIAKGGNFVLGQLPCAERIHQPTTARIRSVGARAFARTPTGGP